MPHNGKSDVILRQGELLRLIPPNDHGGRSSQDLATALEARGYQVTLRTVERDLGTLQHCMSLESNAGTRPQLWRWQKIRGIDIPGMEAAEAMALFMMQDAMRDHLPSCFVDALHSRFAQANKTLAALARGGGVVPHHFAVQRFKSVTLRELEPWTHLPFSLAAFLADGTDQFGDGRLTLRATVRDTWALHAWILGHADSLCIETPAALRQILAGRLRAAAAQYG